MAVNKSRIIVDDKEVFIKSFYDDYKHLNEGIEYTTFSTRVRNRIRAKGHNKFSMDEVIELIEMGKYNKPIEIPKNFSLLWKPTSI